MTKKITTLVFGLLLAVFGFAQEPGNSLNFDGANDYVVTGDNDNGMSAITIETWVYYQEDGLKFICSKGANHLEIHTNTGGNLRFIPVTGVYLDATGVLPLNKWTHIACVYNPSISLAKIYVNAVEVPFVNAGASPLSTAISTINTTNFEIGRRTDGSFPFKGSFDEFRVWSVARTAQEIADNFAQPIDAGSQTGLVSYYSFNEGTTGGDNSAITTVTDSTAGFPGTLTNFAKIGTTSNFVGSYAMVVPIATNATNFTATDFTANWTAPVYGTADNYLLYVATDPNFTNLLAGFNPDTIIGTLDSALIIGLTVGNSYYYRVAAQSTTLSTTGINSNTIETIFGTSASPTSFIFRQVGESKICEIASDRNWTAVSSETWLTLSDANGSGNHSLTLIAAVNNSGATRTATVTISTVSQTDIVIDVTQASITGDGTDLNPYKIYSYTDLCQIDNVNYLFSAVYEVMNNFDAAASQIGEGFLPIGNSTNKFTGKFYGHGHTISNFTINRPATNRVGLFGFTQNAVIDSIILHNADITGNLRVGGIIGYAYDNLNIASCQVTGSITGNGNYSGGLIGFYYTELADKNLVIDNCHTNVILMGTSYIGGICGGFLSMNSINNGITNSSSKGVITGTGSIGGFVGSIYLDEVAAVLTINNCNSAAKVNANSGFNGGFIGYTEGNGYLHISNSYATGDVFSSSNGYSGGFIGEPNSNFQIENCYATGNVTAHGDNVGGFAGYTNAGSFTNCYATGNVNGFSGVGGFIGRLGSNATNCYATGMVTGSNSFIAGFAGASGAAATNCFFNTQTSGQTIFANGGTQTNCSGQTTAQMKQQATFSGFNFTTNWQIRENQTYLALQLVTDNAPFAFGDTIFKHLHTFAFSELLANDYDYETLQTALCLKVESVENGTFDVNNVYFSDTLPLNTPRTAIYRIGELIAVGDTIWGNRAKALLTVASTKPVITSFAVLSTNEDAPITILPANINFTDGENDTIQKITLLSGSNYTFTDTTITPALNYFGEIYVPIRIFDGYEWSVEDTVTITVISVNDAPEIANFQTSATDEDTPFTITNGMVNFTDVENDTLAAIELNTGTNYTFVGTTITPALNYFGTLNIPVRILDGTDWSVYETYVLTVNSINDVPVAEDSTISTVQGVAVTTAPLVTDIDGTIAMLYIETFPQHGTVGVSGSDITYMPNANYFGTDEFQYFAKDNEGAFSNIATISIDISQNSAPVISSAAPASATVGQQYTYEVIATDADNDILTYSLSNAPSGMIITDSIITWTPAIGTSTSGIVTVTVSDGLLIDEENFIVFVSTSGFSDLSKNGILVYPNPTSGVINFDFSKLEVQKITISDMTGKVLIEKSTINEQLKIDFSNFSNGIYLINIQTDKEVFTTKIVKE